MKYRIDVTDEDIRTGGLANPDTCPVARAMSRVLGEPIGVDGDVFYRTAIADRDNYFYLPEWVQDAIIDFDDGKGMLPFVFEVEV